MNGQRGTELSQLFRCNVQLFRESSVVYELVEVMKSEEMVLILDGMYRNGLHKGRFLPEGVYTGVECCGVVNVVEGTPVHLVYNMINK